MDREHAYISAPTPKSPEELKQEYTSRINAVLYQPLTVDNIEHFADRALDDTAQIVDDLVREYETNPLLGADPSLTKREKEDTACAKLGLPDVPRILGNIMEVKDRIDTIRARLEMSHDRVNEVITPPDPSAARLGSGEGGTPFESAGLVPRLLTLMYILQTDFGIDVSDKAQVQILEGRVSADMMRQVPYARVTIPELARTVYICDEEGNASYVFDTAKLGEYGVSLDELDIEGKKDKNTIIAQYPGVGVRVVQSRNWRSRMRSYLLQELPDQAISQQADALDPESGQAASSMSATESEFVRYEKKTFKDYSEFKKDVISFFDSSAMNVDRWYRENYKNHPGWPSHPEVKYILDWQSWPELVGKPPIRTERIIDDYQSFKEEVVSSYSPSAGTDIRVWYRTEKKNHPSWPSAPDQYYENMGWVGWSELVDRYNMHKKEYPAFENFVVEVRAAYTGQGGVSDWYRSEYKKHKNWPSVPERTYRDKGWKDWSDLVGRTPRK